MSQEWTDRGSCPYPSSCRTHRGTVLSTITRYLLALVAVHRGQLRTRSCHAGPNRRQNRCVHDVHRGTYLYLLHMNFLSYPGPTNLPEPTLWFRKWEGSLGFDMPENPQPELSSVNLRGQVVKPVENRQGE